MSLKINVLKKSRWEWKWSSAFFSEGVSIFEPLMKLSRIELKTSVMIGQESGGMIVDVGIVVSSKT